MMMEVYLQIPIQIVMVVMHIIFQCTMETIIKHGNKSHLAIFAYFVFFNNEYMIYTSLSFLLLVFH